MTQHGSAVMCNGKGILILGGSGSGKSSLALHLIAMGATLIADDVVKITNSNRGVILSCPQSIKGMIEARGIGLLTVMSIDSVPLDIVVDLSKSADSRLPHTREITFLECKFPLLHGKGNSNLSAILLCLTGGGQLLPMV